MNDFKDYLAHHGILGMKWGIRRFRNYDGSLTNAGRKRYDSPGNLRYKKTAKEQEARKKKRRTRAKQIAKGLAAAALVGGAGYAAYKLSKKAAPALAKAMHRYDSLMGINNNQSNGPIIVNKKTGQVITDPDELRRAEEYIEARRSGLDPRTIEQSEPSRVNVDRVEPNQVPVRSAEEEAAKTREFVFIASRQGDPEDSLRALREHPDLNTPGSRDFLQERFKSRLKERQSEPIFRDDGLMHISRIDSSEAIMAKSSWNAEKAGKRKPGHFEKQNAGLTMGAYEELVRKYADPYLAYRAKHPETYGLQSHKDPAYFYEEWDI